MSQMRVTYPVLISVYAIVPVLCIVAFVDWFYFGAWIQKNLPSSPESIFLIALLFNVPHHVGSLFGFLDKEYLLYYRRRFLVDIPLVLLAFFSVWYAWPLLALVVFILYTEYHIVSQQGGIACALMKNRPRLYNVWRLLVIGVFSFPYLIINSKSVFGLQLSLEVLYALSFVSAVAFLLVTLRMRHESKTKEGARYFLVASAAILSGYFLFMWGYPILAFFLSRFVHDVTAFVFYVAHDTNRTAAAHTNALYLLWKPLKIPLFILTPTLAVVIAFLISETATTITLLLIFVTHYYVESFMWKRGSLHRSYVRFAE